MCIGEFVLHINIKVSDLHIVKLRFAASQVVIGGAGTGVGFAKAYPQFGRVLKLHSFAVSIFGVQRVDKDDFHIAHYLGIIDMAVPLSIFRFKSISRNTCENRVCGEREQCGRGDSRRTQNGEGFFHWTDPFFRNEKGLKMSYVAD